MVPDVLGRCRNGKGTLELEMRENKIGCRCELPHTNNANDTLELMRRGIITGMSFAFEDDWEDTENGVSYERTAEMHDGKEVWLRHVKRITGLYDVAIVTHPAYEQTSVGLRELGDTIDKAIDLQIEMEKRETKEAQKRACGDDEKREDDTEENDNPKDDNDDMHDDDEDRLEEQAEKARMMRMQRLHWQRRKMDENFKKLT